MKILRSASSLALAAVAGCSSGGSGTIQCGPNVVCAGNTTCSIPVNAGSPDYANATCVPYGVDAGGGPGATTLACTDRSACAPDQICCANYQSSYPFSICETASPGKCNSAVDPLARWCASSAECDAPQTCVTDKIYPWIKSCQ